MNMIKAGVISRAIVVAASAYLCSSAHGAFLEVPIGSLANANIRTYTFGTDYPIAPTTLVAGDIDFQLVPLNSVPDSLGVLQLDAPGTSFTIATNIASPTTVYTLINSGFGQVGAHNASIQFVGANGANATFDLIQGDNIRDHANNTFNNNAPNTFPSLFGSVRLDRQTFVLPSAFATDTLTQIKFTALDSGVPQGVAFLAAVTVATVPEPSTLLLVGLVGFGVLAIRRR